jgi:hypothetical protein
MKKSVLVLILACGVGCGGAYLPMSKKSDEPSAFEQTIRGDQLEDPGQYRINRDILAKYQQEIRANANELLIRTDPGDDLFHVTEVEIESVFLGDPSIIGARVSGVVDGKFDRWGLMHPEGDKAEFAAHYLFGPDGQYQGIRNADLVRVWN